MSGKFCVYILTNKVNTVLHTGVTNDLVKKITDYKNGSVDKHTKKYGINKLVYFEVMSNVVAALAREKELSKMKREWQHKKIQEKNPNWDDLYPSLLEK